MRPCSARPAPSPLSEGDIAAYLQAERHRSRGKPALTFRSIVWLANAGGFEWPTKAPLVKAQCAPPAVGAAPASMPAQAPCPSLDMPPQYLNFSLFLVQSEMNTLKALSHT